MKFTVLQCHSCILLLLALAIVMEIPAWLNDRRWNDILRDETERFSLNDLRKCTLTLMNGTILIPGQNEYAQIFQCKIRDLPLENIFLTLASSSFIIYLLFSVNCQYLKRTTLNNYVIIMAVNFLGTVLHLGACISILSSSVMYSEKFRKYMGSEVCYNFQCKDCPEDNEEYLSAAKKLYLNTRYCLEGFHVCQSNWLKDRIVFLLLGCITASTSAFVSSLRSYYIHRR